MFVARIESGAIGVGRELVVVHVVRLIAQILVG